MRRFAVAAYAWGAGGAFVAALGYLAFTFLIVMAKPVPPGVPGTGLSAVLIDVALFGVFALHHSLYARERIKQAVREAVSPSLERSTYVWISSALLMLVCVAWRPVAGVLYAHGGALAWLHGIMVASGVGLTAVGAARLRAFDLAGIDQALGRPSEGGASQELVVAWPYTMVRHPIYLAWLLMVFGPATMTGTRFTFASVSSAYLALAIPFEERLLVKHFGDGYRHYKQRVRWRMIPFVY